MRIHYLKKSDEDVRNSEDVGIESMAGLRPVKVVGRGAMGTVFLAQGQDCEKPALAMKVMSKPIMEKKSDGLKRARTEREILSGLRHPFLPELMGYVETDKIVAWVMDYCPGGDLNALRHRQAEKMFSESTIRFYAAEIVLALEHLHSLGVVYRDLKPENVLIQSNGHIMLTDFDLSTRLPPQGSLSADNVDQEQENEPSQQRASLGCLIPKNCVIPQNAKSKKGRRPNTARVSPVVKPRKGTSPNAAASSSPTSSVCGQKLNSFVGTEEYVSPEMVKDAGHDFRVDWWALGILLYEMQYGKTPFKGATRKETFYKILVQNPEFMGPWTPLRDLILKLLEKEPEKRLASARNIKSHLFFRGLNWDAVPHIPRAPYVPPPVSHEDLSSLKTLDIEQYIHKEADPKEDDKDNRAPTSPKEGETNDFGLF